jgi:long-chain acyl-CoA synthetase
VQDSVTPILVEPDPTTTLADVPGHNARSRPENIAFSTKSGNGWVDVTAAEFNTQVRDLAKGLIAAGIHTGDTVGIMSRTRYEWTLADFAVWLAGAVSVPVYETSSADQVEWIASDSKLRAMIVETPDHAKLVESVRARVPAIEDVWQIEAGDLDDLAASGADVDEAEVDRRIEAMRREDLATIIYTSGTTGRPKGCELTHGNFLTLAENAVSRLEDVVRAPGASTLLFLPLAHVFARFIEVLAVVGEVRMGHSADIKNILDDFGAFHPTFILAVPRVFEKIYNRAEATAESSGKGRIFASAARTATEWSEALDAGGPGVALRLKHAVFDRLVYSTLRSRMGGLVQYAVSGGAPLGTRLGHFFRGIGVTVLEGYGLTETTAPATVNVPGGVKIGTVGPPLPGVSIRIADDGEVLVSGINVLRGYHDNPDATAEALRDEWFHTGDVGELDEDGYLRITGRKKEILVTAGGKNVAPAVLEDRLRAHSLVSQCMVVGDQKPFIAAIITLDEEMLPEWGSNHGLGTLSVEQARAHSVVLEEIQVAVDDANRAVSKAESIRKFVVLDTDFTEDSGHLTPSLKLKRNVVMRDFGDEIESLYS